jgi:hypothetical protein
MIINYEKYVYPENILQIAVAFLFVEFFELLKILSLYDTETGFKTRKLFWSSVVFVVSLLIIFLVSFACMSLIYYVFKTV